MCHSCRVRPATHVADAGRADIAMLCGECVAHIRDTDSEDQEAVMHEAENHELACRDEYEAQAWADLAAAGGLAMEFDDE